MYTSHVYTYMHTPPCLTARVHGRRRLVRRWILPLTADDHLICAMTASPGPFPPSLPPPPSLPLVALTKYMRRYAAWRNPHTACKFARKQNIN